MKIKSTTIINSLQNCLWKHLIDLAVDSPIELTYGVIYVPAGISKWQICVIVKIHATISSKSSYHGFLKEIKILVLFWLSRLLESKSWD
jgi:hypothetical protein